MIIIIIIIITTIKATSSDERALAPRTASCGAVGGCSYLLLVCHVVVYFVHVCVHVGSVIDLYEADFLCPVGGAIDMTQY